MHEALMRIGPLDCCVVGEAQSARLLVLFLHGYAMRPEDLAPFAHALGIPQTLFVFPRGPVALPQGRHAWWPLDQRARERALRFGARDLAHDYPSGRAAARAALRAVAEEARARWPTPALVLAGFSQGAMLACETLLVDALEADALAMLSASRLALADWQRCRQRLSGRRAFVSHGRADADLAFDAGERLQQFLSDAGAQVTWVPFGSGHEIPFTVWREFRGFLGGVRDAACSAGERWERRGAA